MLVVNLFDCRDRRIERDWTQAVNVDQSMEQVITVRGSSLQLLLRSHENHEQPEKRVIDNNGQTERLWYSSTSVSPHVAPVSPSSLLS